MNHGYESWLLIGLSASLVLVVWALRLMESKFLVKPLHSCCHCHRLGTKYRIVLCRGCYCMLHLGLLPRVGPLVLCPKWLACQNVVYSQWAFFALVTLTPGYQWCLFTVDRLSHYGTNSQLGIICPPGNIWYCLEPFLFL